MTAITGGLPRAKANLLVLAYVAFIGLGLPFSLMGVAWPTLRAELALPLDALGLLLIATTLGYLVSSFSIARLIYRFGIGSLLILSSLFSAFAFIGYTVAPAWAFIIVLGAVGGFGSGVMDAGLNTYVAAEYNEGQMQWLHACFGLGATLSPLIMTASLALFASWRPAFLFVAAFMILMAICFSVTRKAWKRPNRVVSEAATSSDAERGLMDYHTSLWETLLRLVTWISIFMFMLSSGANSTLGSWSYTLFTEGRGISPQIAGLWTAGFWATFTIGRVVAGLLAHRITLNAMLIGAMALALVGSIGFWWNPIVWAGMAGVLVVGFALAPIFPGLTSGTSQRVGQRHAGNTIGIQVSASSLGGAIVPALAGLLAARISLEIIPVLLTVCVLALLTLYMLSTRVRIAA